MTIPPTYTTKHQQSVMCAVTTIILLLLGFSGRTQVLDSIPGNRDSSEIFEIEKEYQYQGKTYQAGRMLLKDFTYGSLTLRIIKDGNSMDISAPMDEYPDLEMSETRLIQLHNRPFFLVKDRYRVYLIDLEQEKISARIEPGQSVEYGDDAISGTIGGFQFFDHDKYLIGYAVSYGPFCFNISDLRHPRELQRYTAQYGDNGQPYFFLEQQANRRWNGFIAQSDTLRHKLFKGIKNTRFLFQDAHLSTPEDIYVDPADYENGHPEPFLLLQEVVPMPNDPDNPQAMDLQPWVIDLKPWVIDLQKGKLLKGKAADQFIKSQR